MRSSFSRDGDRIGICHLVRVRFVLTLYVLGKMRRSLDATFVSFFLFAQVG